MGLNVVWLLLSRRLRKDAHSFSPATFINKGVRHDSMRNLLVKSKNVTFEQWDGGKMPTSRESPAQ